MAGEAYMGFLDEAGFLGTRAHLGADLALVLTLIAAVLFTVGWRLAVDHRYDTHRRVMTTAVLLNAAVVLVWMVRSFVLYVWPKLPAGLDQRAYAVNTVHAVIGVIGLVLGVFVVLRGNELVPKALRFSNYKAYMRTSYVLYMVATLAGIAVYVVAYVDHLV